MKIKYESDGRPFIIHIIEEIEFPDGEYYPVRFSIECERVDEGHVEYISRPWWSEELYDLAQNALIRRFAESKEMKKIMDEYHEQNF